MGEGAYWSADTYLLALIGDALQAANWQRANAGAKAKSPFPKPIPRPQVEGQQKQGRRLGAGKGVPIDEMKQRLGWE
jgi:hypothetical protein